MGRNGRDMKKMKKPSIARSIREAIDSYPGGLCFAALSGKPILVNRQMNTLIEILTGHTVIEANLTWEEIQSISERGGCKRSDEPWLKTELFHSDDRSAIFIYPDGKVWQFRRQLLLNGSVNMVQIEASEITQLYRISEKLYNNNIRLAEMHKRQEALLENIVQINHDRELLATKMRIHDDLGRCLVATKKAIGSTDGLSNETYNKLLSSWKEAIGDMTNVPLQTKDNSPETELLRVADLVGCHISFIGEQPKERRTLLLLYSAIREALTNAVRHAGANRLTVEIQRFAKNYHILISSNGRSEVTHIVESGGLNSLRMSLEQWGATLDYQYGQSVTMVINIPAKEEKA